MAKKKYITPFATFLLISFVAFAVGLVFGLFYPPRPTADISSTVLRQEDYTVTQPFGFNIIERTANQLVFADKKYERSTGNKPRVSIRKYVGVLPEDIELLEFITKLSDPGSPVIENEPKDCSIYFKKIVKMGSKMPENELMSNSCLYMGVENIENTEFKGFLSYKFKSMNVSTAAEHLVFVYGNDGSFYDVSITITSMADHKDRTEQAYRDVLNSISFGN